MAEMVADFPTNVTVEYNGVCNQCHYQDSPGYNDKLH